MTTLTDSHIFVGNSSNVATDVAMSGDATIADTGVVTVSIGIDKLTDATYTTSSDHNMILGQNVTLTSGATQNVFIGEFGRSRTALLKLHGDINHPGRRDRSHHVLESTLRERFKNTTISIQDPNP